MLRGSGSDEALWPFSHSDLLQTYAAACRNLHLTKLETSLCSLRHGGASGDYLLKRRSLADIQFRGRWASDSSLRRYQKTAVVQRESLQIGTEGIKAAKVIELNLAYVFDDPSYAAQLIAPLLK